MRRGTIGIAVAYSGFMGLRNYIGKPDLFGRPLHVTQSNLAGGFASAAVVVMGEGAESTPIAIISDVQDIEFSAEYPDANEISECVISPKEDLFAPFLQAVEWLPSGGTKNDSNLR
jgi:F420-0:gamma-glutamyl ligase